jgi:tetratricopeptide (TPR) repeat protein
VQVFVDFGIMPQENTSLNLNESFTQALALQQQKNWDESLKVYQKTLDEGRQNLTDAQASVIYHNMSILAHEKADGFKAYVWSKKAFHLNPSNDQAKQIYEVYAKSFNAPNISHQVSDFDHVQNVIAKVPVDLAFSLSVLLILGSLALALKNWVLKRKSLSTGEYSEIRKWPVYVLSTLAVFSLGLSYFSYKSSQKQIAIVIAEKAQVQTVPGENKPVIFEAPAGLELEVLSFNENFFQVRYKGAFSGWVNKSQIELLSLSFQQ